MTLANKSCIPCQKGVPPLERHEIDKFKAKISPHWELKNNNKRLFRTFKFQDFSSAMDLAQKIGKIADNEWHHPELHVGFGHLEVEIWTHKIDALVESDFILAAKIDELVEGEI